MHVLVTHISSRHMTRILSSFFHESSRKKMTFYPKTKPHQNTFQRNNYKNKNPHFVLQYDCFLTVMYSIQAELGSLWELLQGLVAINLTNSLVASWISINSSLTSNNWKTRLYFNCECFLCV